MAKLIDLTGKKLGYLLVIKRLPVKNRRTYWECKCECGKIITKRFDNVRVHSDASCGCIGKLKSILAATKHNDCNTTEYNTYKGIKRRCFNKKYRGYLNYGARGITMSKEWADSYKTFLSDMGRKPSPHHEIERIDNNGNYCKENCRWATRKEQCNNTRANRKITINGVTKNFSEWLCHYNLLDSTVRARLHRGWDIIKSFTTPANFSREIKKSSQT